MTPLPLLLLARAQAASIAGTITGGGEPLDGVTVQVMDLRLQIHEATTDPNGAWRIDDLNVGGYRVRAVPPSDMARVVRFYPNARDYCEGEIVWLAGSEGSSTGVDIELEEGGSLTGRLTDHAGGPVGNVLVVAESADGYAEYSDKGALTAADGAFQILGLDAPVGGEAVYRCGASVEGWPAQYLGETYDEVEAQGFAVRSGEDTDAGTQPLLDGIFVSGTVVGPEGPLPASYVHVYASSQVVTVQTDDAGHYVASGLPPGAVLAWTTPTGHGLTYYPNADRPTETVDVLAEGETYDGLDLYPPKEAIFQANLIAPDPAGGDLSGVTALLYNDEGTVGIGASSDAGGALRIEGLQGGTDHLFVYAADEGFQNDYVRGDDGEPLPIEVTGETSNPAIDLVLPRGARIAGWLTDDEGAPVYGAYVIARLEDSTITATSDAEGRYELAGLAAGRWSLEATYTPYCTADPGYVHVYNPGVLTESEALVLDLKEGDVVSDLDLVMPNDDDHDAMGDAWEEKYGLDTTRDDALEDPDKDGYTNLDEYLLGSDPTEKGDSFGCGCKNKHAGLLGLPLLGWGALRRLTFGGARRRARAFPLCRTSPGSQ